MSRTPQLAAQAAAALDRLGVNLDAHRGVGLSARTPLTDAELFALAPTADPEAVIKQAQQAFHTWRTTPAPVRGQLVARLGELLTAHKADLAELVTIEAGKISSEARGEVQEMIDICAFAVGLSRQLYGKTMPSERYGHRLAESWHPLGVVGVISAFNFPVAVWSWNAALALVCGDAVVWKPSELTPLCALACQQLVSQAAAELGAPAGLSGLLLGGREVGQQLVDSPLVALVSATGSTRMGREVGPRVASRFGRVLLELGGNNAAVITPSANLEVAINSVVFSAAGTAGQRCTTTRRLIVHNSIMDEVIEKLVAAYQQLPIGDPTAPETLVGPLINSGARAAMSAAISAAVAEGGQLLVGGESVEIADLPGSYVRPALVKTNQQSETVRKETFAPILYVLGYAHWDEAIALHNGVPQGLSGAIFTSDANEAEQFLAANGADTGIANVNVGTSGAEIGGAFGGEKETGGGRESGSDAWQAYMRRATNTINYSGAVQLAQGVNFSGVEQ